MQVANNEIWVSLANKSCFISRCNIQQSSIGEFQGTQAPTEGR